MIASSPFNPIRVVQKFVTQDEYRSSNSAPVTIVTGVPGFVLQAVNCTIQFDPAQLIAYDQMPYIFSVGIESPQLVALGFAATGYSILSQSVTFDIGNALGSGLGLFLAAAQADPTVGEGGMWVSLWYTIWPNKRDAF